MKNPGPCAVCSFVAHSHTPCNRCVRFATTVASGHATLATKRTLLLTWAGLPPAGSHQLCLAHSLDHLVGAGEKGGSYLNSDGLSCLGVDDQFEPCRLLNRKVSRLRTSKNTIKVYKHVLVHFIHVWPVREKPTCTCPSSPAARQRDFFLRCQIDDFRRIEGRVPR